MAFLFGGRLDPSMTPLVLLDTAGLSLFAVSGAMKAVNFDLGMVPAALLGAITAVGGGTMRDVLTGRVPVVLRSELYAIPALAGAAVVSVSASFGGYGVPVALAGALLCFGIRMLGVRFGLDAPKPPGEASTR